jgi:hypothetical protein
MFAYRHILLEFDGLVQKAELDVAERSKEQHDAHDSGIEAVNSRLGYEGPLQEL